jgi:hypothetical protein
MDSLVYNFLLSNYEIKVEQKIFLFYQIKILELKKYLLSNVDFHLKF